MDKFTENNELDQRYSVAVALIQGNLRNLSLTLKSPEVVVWIKKAYGLAVLKGASVAIMGEPRLSDLPVEAVEKFAEITSEKHLNQFKDQIHAQNP